MTVSLPTPGGDSGTWGTQLNAFLNVAHNSDGTLATVAQASDWINVTGPDYGADNTGGVDATAIIQAALNAAPVGGTVYVPTGIYTVSYPIIIPPTVSLVGSGRTHAYDSGSQPMTYSGPVFWPTGTFAAGNYNGQAVKGVFAVLGITLNLGGALQTSHNFISTAASPAVFTATGSSYANGTQVVLSSNIAGSPGFDTTDVYYVVGVSGTQFNLSASSGGTGLSASAGGSGTVTQMWGSANQTIRNITINGKNAPSGTNGIEAWSAVWALQLDNVGVYHMPQYGIYTNKSTSGNDLLHYPDMFQMINCHFAGNHSDGVNMVSMSDCHFIDCESTGNTGNGWTLSGDNMKIMGCKAEYNGSASSTGYGMTIARGGGSRPILVHGFGTDGNYLGGIQLTGTGPGPVVLTGCGLNYDGQNNGAGGAYGALSITGGMHVTATNLNITTGIAGSANAWPTNGILLPSTFSGALQIENSEIYGGTTAVNLSATATGTVRYGPNVLTGAGSWANPGVTPLTNIVHAASPQTDIQQYAKYWSGSGWATPTGQQPRESMPYYNATGTPTIAGGQLSCAVIPVQPGDLFTYLGFVAGSTALTVGVSPNWWVALYSFTTATTISLITQCPTQTASFAINTSHLMPLNTPYTVPPGVYALMGVINIYSGSSGGTQPTLKGTSGSATMMGGANDLFNSSTVMSSVVGSAGTYTTGTAPAGPVTIAPAANTPYMGAC